MGLTKRALIFAQIGIFLLGISGSFLYCPDARQQYDELVFDR